MPIHRGPRLTDLISRLSYRAMPIEANIYQTWPKLAAGLVITPSQTAPTWVEYVSAASAPTRPFTVTHVAAPVLGSSANAPILFEIGTGSAGSEVAVASCVWAGYNNGQPTPAIVSPLPIIPGGTRITLRAWGGANQLAQSYVVTALLPKRLDQMATLMATMKQTSYYPGKSAMFGASTTATSGGTAWTYGAYTELYAATVETSSVIIAGVGSLGDIQFGGTGQVALATGASGAEVVFGEFPMNIYGGWVITLPIPILVPGSTRYTYKWATAGTSNTLYQMQPHFIKAAYMP